MGKRRSIESKIRDWLELNLDFIDPNLKLVEKEKHLPDTVGAAGRVDILCTDQYNNFVIIEIKRSEQSARDAISEILKYRSLIRHNYTAKESEIRIIIISTVWKELIRPFSEAVCGTRYDISGYLIEINDQSIPISIKKVDPLPLATTRQHTYSQGLFLFDSAERRDAFYADFKPYLLKTVPNDFVLVKILGDLNNEQVNYPYGVIVSFQELSNDELLNYISKLDSELYEELFTREEFDDEQEYKEYLQSRFINSLDCFDHFQDGGSCYPSMLFGMLTKEGWSTQVIEKFGIFEKDPRYSDAMLLNELQGLDGSNKNMYYGKTDSTQKEKLTEITQMCRNSLRHTPVWLETVDAIMEILKHTKRKFILTVDIFNPTSLITALYHTMVYRKNTYLPVYYIYVEYSGTDEAELYHGSIRWSGECPQSDFIKPLPQDDNGERVFNTHFDADNQKEAKAMELGYKTSKFIVTAKESKFAGFFKGSGELIIPDNIYLYPFEQFGVLHEAQLNILVANYERSYVTMNQQLKD